jgi:hypothetical protein
MSSTIDKTKWPPGVRTISIDELDYLGLDAQNRLYWDGKAVSTALRLTTWQTVAAAIAAGAALMSGLNGLYDLGHKLGLY